MAERFLGDTGVFVRWYIEQDGFEHALRIQAAHLDGSAELETVDLVRFELGQVLRNKGLLNKKIKPKEYVAAVRSLDDLGLRIHVTTADMLERAADLASGRMIGFNDAVLVVWALERGSTLLTSDRRLCSAAAGLVPTQLLLGVAP